jgi:hypothetical protein
LWKAPIGRPFLRKGALDHRRGPKGLRYGENPGQEAALYKLVNGNLVLGDTETIQPGRYLVSDIELLQSGKHPGKTNLTDADNALNILRYFTDRPTAIIVKHNNPCGVARADSLVDAYLKANLADRVAAFGGCIAVNRPVDKSPRPRPLPGSMPRWWWPPISRKGSWPSSAASPTCGSSASTEHGPIAAVRGTALRGIQKPDRRRHHHPMVVCARHAHRETLRLAECEYKGQTYRISGAHR